jgi:hypothetical protein
MDDPPTIVRLVDSVASRLFSPPPGQPSRSLDIPGDVETAWTAFCKHTETGFRSDDEYWGHLRRDAPPPRTKALVGRHPPTEAMAHRLAGLAASSCEARRAIRELERRLETWGREKSLPVAWHVFNGPGFRASLYGDMRLPDLERWSVFLQGTETA